MGSLTLSATAALSALLLLVVPSAFGASQHPTLTLSRSSGTVGTRVTVIGRDCRKPIGQRDTLAWHDHFYWQHDIEKRPPIGVWRSIPLVRTSVTTVRATFTVERSDHAGRGLLDLFCSNGGNATAAFTVER